MPPTTIFNAGDVVRVPFPFTNQHQKKVRPALVVSSAEFHDSRIDVILIPITSTPPNNSLEFSLRDWKKAGLLNASTVKPVLMTVLRSSIVKIIGRLTENDLTAVSQILRRTTV